LRTSGKARCERPDSQLFPALLHLLDHENAQVRTYVNGTLYSLLSRKKLRVKAKDLGIDTRLAALRPRSEEQFQRQIDCIIEQLTTPSNLTNTNTNTNTNSDDPDASDNDGSSNENKDGDEDEDEDEDGTSDENDDEEDELVNDNGAKGEALLCAQYLAETTNARTQIQSSQHALDEQSARLSRRTPSMNHHLNNYSSISSSFTGVGGAAIGSGLASGPASPAGAVFPFSESPRVIGMVMGMGMGSGAPFPQRAVTPRVRGGRPDSSPFKSIDMIARTPLHHSRANGAHVGVSANISPVTGVGGMQHHGSMLPNLSSIPQYRFAYNLPAGANINTSYNINNNNMHVPIVHGQHHSIGGGPPSSAMVTAAAAAAAGSSGVGVGGGNIAPRPPIPMHPSSGRPPVYGYSAAPAAITIATNSGTSAGGGGTNNMMVGTSGRAPSSRATTWASTIGDNSTSSSSSTTNRVANQPIQPQLSVPGAVPSSSSSSSTSSLPLQVSVSMAFHSHSSTSNTTSGSINSGSGSGSSGSVVSIAGIIAPTLTGGRAAHARSLRKIPPPTSGTVVDDVRPQDESLSQYYKAFASRSRVGRTPIGGSIYALRVGHSYIHTIISCTSIYWCFVNHVC
jgi:hypothetical protein